MTRLTIALLGEPRILLSDQVVACAAKKSLGLFYYLAQSGKRHSRRELARLFWGGGNEEAARTSLRTALQRLPAALAQCLSVERDHVALAADADLDTARFAVLAARSDMESLAEASRLYGGELLKNLEIDAAPEFDDWLHRERTRYRQLAQATFEQLIARHRERTAADPVGASAERAAAMTVAQRWIGLEPAAESAHRALMQLYLDAGRRDAASAQYEACQRELAVAFGRGPGAQTRALLDSIGADSNTAALAPAQMPASSATLRAPELAATSFVGRVEELAALEQLLSDPACRLLTLHALGGMGKSRLAFALANQMAPRFALGATWVALDSVQSPELLAHAVARALQIELPARGEPDRALCAALHAQERLLVLDNFEHLLVSAAGQGGGAAVELVLMILRDAPRVRVLVTSREVLGVQEEWVYEVRGLGYPAADAKAALASGHFPAVELFVQRARQAYLGFSAQAEWPHIVRICTLVEGLPLALELTAAWVRTIPCGDLAHAVENELAALTTRHHNRPARQQSLDAVVRTSWSLLPREQQQVLAALSVFVGGFAQEAAHAVAEASLRVLSALVDKALVNRRADGRLGLHELVRQFAHAQHSARVDVVRLVRRRYATFYAALLERQSAMLDGPGELDAETALTAELGNLLNAAPIWLEEGAVETIAEPLLRMLLGRSLIREVIEYADGLLACNPRLALAARALIYGYRGRAHGLLGGLATGEADFDTAIQIGREFGLSYPLGYALVYRVAIDIRSNRLEAALAHLADAEQLFASIDDPRITMRARFNAGVVLDALGRVGEAEARLREALEVAQRLGAPSFLATVESTLAIPLIRLGRFDESEPLLHEALVLFERLGRHHETARLLNALALVLLWRSNGAEAAAAERHAVHALQLSEQIGLSWMASQVCDTLGQALAAQGRTDEARAYFKRAAESSSPHLTGEARFHQALLELEQGRVETAVVLAGQLEQVARQHDVEPLKRRSQLLAAAISAAKDSTAACDSLRSLLAIPDLEIELKLRARALLARFAA